MYELNYGEHKTRLSNIDFTVIGSGIVALCRSIFKAETSKEQDFGVGKRDTLPRDKYQNDGFACFGSISKILSDLKTHTEQKATDLVKRRKEQR